MSRGAASNQTLGLGGREYVRGGQCPKLPARDYYRGAEHRRRGLSPGGCVVGALAGAIVAEFGTAGLAPEAGAIGGCAVGTAVL